jgi:DNA mismatch repair protein MutS
MTKPTPMMQQYFEVKRGVPRDTLLLFRLGDFFELFFDDAVVASKLLGLTLTRRQETPMAGLPAQALDNYVSKLLAAGKKVAICDQAEPAKAGKLVRRQLTRILSPGTTLAANQLEAARNHYLAAIALDKHGLHAAWLDLSTGEFQVASDGNVANLLPVLTALDPAELLIIEGERERWATLPPRTPPRRKVRRFIAPPPRHRRWPAPPASRPAGPPTRAAARGPACRARRTASAPAGSPAVPARR